MDRVGDAQARIGGQGSAERLSRQRKQLTLGQQRTHSLMLWVILLGCIATVGMFIYALYASVMWKQVGEQAVVLSWLGYFLAVAAVITGFGIDASVTRVTPPADIPKLGGQVTGDPAIRRGRTYIAGGVVLAVLVAVGMILARAGRFGLEEWITTIVVFFVALGMGSAIVSVIRRIARRPG